MAENPVNKLTTGYSPRILGDTTRYPIDRGTTGIRRQQGATFIYEEFLPQLSVGRRSTIYHQIASNSSIIGASLHAIRSLLRRPNLTLKPAGTRPRHKRAVEIVEASLTQQRVRSLVDTASAAMLIYGFSLNAMIPDYDPDKGVYTISSMPPRSPRSLMEWLWDESRDVPWGVRQTAMAYGMSPVDIPLRLCLHCRTTGGAADDPEGVSPLRSCYLPDYYARRLGEMEAIGIERDLVGLPVLKLPGEMLDPNATAEQRTALATFQKMVEDVRRDTSEGVILPSDRDEKGNAYFELSLLSVASSRKVEPGTAVERYERRIAQSFLTDFLFIGQGANGSASAGSYALADNKTGLFVLSLQSLHNSIGDEINTKPIPTIGMMNAIDPEDLPTAEFEEIEPLDAEALANFVEKLSKSGLEFTDKPTQEILRETVGLPMLPEDWEPPPSRAEEARAKEQLERDQLAAQQAQAEASAAQPESTDTQKRAMLRLVENLK